MCREFKHMSSIARNHKTSTLVTIAALAVVASTGSIQFVLAAHDVNVQTYINQREECKTKGKFSNLRFVHCKIFVYNYSKWQILEHDY